MINKAMDTIGRDPAARAKMPKITATKITVTVPVGEEAEDGHRVVVAVVTCDGV